MGAVIIAIANQKGGIGKTTTAQTLAAGLARAGKRTLLIDLDPQCNLSSASGARESELSAYDLLAGTQPVRDIVQTIGDGLDIIPGSYYLAGIEGGKGKEVKITRLRDRLKPLKKDYDRIVIDCPPALGLITVSVLTTSDYVVIPAQADVFSIDAIKQLARTIAGIKAGTNRGIIIAGILLTRYNGRNNVTKATTERLEADAAEIGIRVFRSRIRDAVAIREMQAFRKDLFTYAPKSNVAKDYAAALDELEEIITEG